MSRNFTDRSAAFAKAFSFCAIIRSAGDSRSHYSASA